jgi:hypothetical protein
MPTSDSAGLYIKREQAEEILREKLLKAGISLDSKTARCMFEKTLDSHNVNRCKFGNTPLWGSEIRVRNGLALRSEFMEFVQRLCDSGQDHQRAGCASWGR